MPTKPDGLLTEIVYVIQLLKIGSKNFYCLPGRVGISKWNNGVPFWNNRHPLAATTRHENRHPGKLLAGIQKSYMDNGFRRYDGRTFIYIVSP